MLVVTSVPDDPAALEALAERVREVAGLRATLVAGDVVTPRIGEYLRAVCEEAVARHGTKRQAAALLGISPKTLEAYLRGERRKAHEKAGA